MNRCVRHGKIWCRDSVCKYQKQRAKYQKQRAKENNVTSSPDTEFLSSDVLATDIVDPTVWSDDGTASTPACDPAPAVTTPEPSYPPQVDPTPPATPSWEPPSTPPAAPSTHGGYHSGPTHHDSSPAHHDSSGSSYGGYDSGSSSSYDSGGGYDSGSSSSYDSGSY
jgi:hypothetical protein